MPLEKNRRRRKKKCSCIRNTDEKDRISSLSDDLLHRILSFMDTVYASRTCALSKRWRYLWTSLPYLYFDYENFPFTGRGRGLDYEYTDFISQVLMRRDSSSKLIKFDIRSFSRQVGRLGSFLDYALNHNVQELVVHDQFERGVYSIFPKCLFSCQSLTSLTLFCDENPIGHFKSMDMPALRFLHLDYVKLDYDELSGEDWFFSNCPSLETLKFTRLFLTGREKFNIQALNLRVLELSCENCYHEVECEIINCEVMIVAPRLSTFKLRSDLSLLCFFDDLTSLEVADVDLFPQFETETEDIIMDLIKVLNEVRHTKSISLSRDTIEVLSEFPELVEDHGSKFENLKYLSLEGSGLEIPGCILKYFISSSTVVRVR